MGGHDRRRGLDSIRSSVTTLPLYSTTQNRGLPKRKGREKNKKMHPNNKYENNRYQKEFGVLNRKITQQETAQDILGVLASTKGALSSVAGGGKMSTVNFSTSTHRIARHVTQYTSKNKPGNDRAKILSDPRFALLMCSMAEALLDGAEKSKSANSRNCFGARELANVAWAVAKINIAPPDSVVPVDINNAGNLLREKSQVVRSIIFDVAKQRAI